VTGQITGLLYPEHEAHDVRRAMRQVAWATSMIANLVSGNPVATLSIAGGKEAFPMTRSYFCRARSERLGT
jgi:hypothetical protein